MPFDPMYREEAPTREDVDEMRGLVVLEFGADWCGYCQELSPTLKELLTANPQVQHVRVADGRGKRLGRSFRVKLWPTLIFLKDGKELARAVRPTGVDELRSCMQVLLDASTSS